jgi:hypothetical protein
LRTIRSFSLRLAAVRQVGDLGAHRVGDHLGQVVRSRCVSVIWLSTRGRAGSSGGLGDGDLDALTVSRMDERAGLAAGAVHGQRMPDRGRMRNWFRTVP